MSAAQLTILVTGGAGFIGSAVVRQLVRETEHLVVNIDKLTYTGISNRSAMSSPHPTTDSNKPMCATARRWRACSRPTDPTQ